MDVRRKVGALVGNLLADIGIKPHASPTETTTRDTFAPARPSTSRPTAANAAPFTLPAQGQWTVDAHTGKASDPVTLYVHGSLPDIEAALGSAGWSKADPQGLKASEHYLMAAGEDEALKAERFLAGKLDAGERDVAGDLGVKAPLILNSSAPHVAGVDRMPVSPQLLDGRPLVAAFEQGNNPTGGRNHLRIFDTGQRDPQGQPVYAIAASRDTGITFAPKHPETGFLFHSVQKDVTSERDLVLSALGKSGQVSNVIEHPMPFANASYLGEKVADSKVIELSLSPAPGVDPLWK